MPVPSPHVLHADHVDLLVTAALRWGLVEIPLDQRDAAGVVETVIGTAVGRLLLTANAAAATALGRTGRNRPVDRSVPVGAYAYRPVLNLAPLEVIKAAQAAEQMCAPAPTWSGDHARELLTAILAAACYRLPGYAGAPFAWSRPDRYDGPPTAIGLDWRPPIAGVRWVGIDAVRTAWVSASALLVSGQVAALLPADLPSRPRVYLLVDECDPEVAWQAVEVMDGHELVLPWPASRAWLGEQLGAPSLLLVP